MDKKKSQKKRMKATEIAYILLAVIADVALLINVYHHW